MAAVMVLNDAVRIGERLGRSVDPRWRAVAEGMVLPRRDRVVVSHDGYRKAEEKGGTPDPLMGVWPFGYRLDPEDEQATLRFYLDLADTYVGSPMLSALYGAWAARTGDRALALRLLDEGYAKFETGRFSQILEYRPDRFPEQPRAGPFFANMGGFLSSLGAGLPAPGARRGRAGNLVQGAGGPAVRLGGDRDRPDLGARPAHALEARHGELARLTPAED